MTDNKYENVLQLHPSNEIFSQIKIDEIQLPTTVQEKNKDKNLKKNNGFDSKSLKSIIVITVFLLELSDFVTDIIAIVDFYNTQQYWYFGLLITFVTIPLLWNIYTAFDNYDFSYLYKFISIFVNLDELWLHFFSNKINVKLFEDSFYHKKVLNFIFESLPSSLLGCYALIVSEQDQNIIIYISFIISNVSSSFSKFKLSEIHVDNDKLFYTLYFLTESFGFSLLWALFSYATKPYGAFSFPIVIFLIYIIHLIITIRKLSEIIDELFRIIIFSIASVFTNYIVFSFNKFAFAKKENNNLIVLFNAIKLLFLIIFHICSLAINQNYNDFLQSNLFTYFLSYWGLIMGIIYVGLSIIIFKNLKNKIES